MGRSPEIDRSLGFGETALIIGIAGAGLLVVGVAHLVSAAITALWPGALKTGPIQAEPTSAEDGPVAPPPG
jgi:hypothetical protein